MHPNVHCSTVYNSQDTGMDEDVLFCALSVISDSATPWTVARQAPLSMRFFRQEYWIGLPFPSPGDLSNPGIKPMSPALQMDSLSSEPPGKPKNTGVGILSFLQGNFPTQESTQGLLHCRQILYQLSYQRSPKMCNVSTMEYYSAIKNEIIPFAATWIDLEMVILSEVSQTEKEKCSMTSLI